MAIERGGVGRSASEVALLQKLDELDGLELRLAAKRPRRRVLEALAGLVLTLVVGAGVYGVLLAPSALYKVLSGLIAVGAGWTWERLGIRHQRIARLETQLSEVIRR